MTINVLIGGTLPRLLRDIVRRLVHDESDINVAAVGLSAVEMVDHVDKYPTAVVIIGCDKKQMDEISFSLLDRARRTRVIAVARGNCDAVSYQLTPTCQRLGQLSPDSLLSAIRARGFSERK
jgi:hypothetical protein